MDDKERIAVLEAQREQLSEQIQEVQADVKDIKKAVTSWRGVVLGISVTVTVLYSTALGIFKILQHKLVG